MENEVQENNHKVTSIVRNVFIIALFALVLILLYRESLQNKKTANLLPQAEISILAVKTISEQTPYTDINSQIPQFKNASLEFNKKIENTITELITEHKQEAKDNWQARLDTQGEDGNLPETPTDPSDRMYFYSKFDTPAQNNDNYVSVLVRFGGYTGGAHPYEEVIAYNYDVKNKHEVSLSELFPNDPEYLNKVSEFARTELTRRFTENLNEGFDNQKEKDNYIKEVIEPMLFDGTDPNKPENFKNFTFTDKEITLHFGQYQVGPYVLGLQDVVMPR